MRLSLSALSLLLACSASLAEGKAVFAHFMVSNTAKFGDTEWRREIQVAQAASIDAFALNMARNEATTTNSVPLAFKAAEALGFKLFFSFDYAGNGTWAKSDVTNLITKYSSSSAYFKEGQKPFVSTFEGPDQAADWVDIKKDTNCFLVPDWSSVGAQPASKLANGVVDGLFSWDAWPKGAANMTTYPDASYYDFLGSKKYMMPVSPWFYTNLPRFTKNWLWRGDDLWFQRWQQVISLDRQPDYVQIISWNDYGESHYIGPLDDTQYGAFDGAPYNYAKDMPHDGWRETLPYYISMYKSGSATVTQERAVAWYRPWANAGCGTGDGTTGNTAYQLQQEFPAWNIMQDRVYYDVLLASNAQVEVKVGSATIKGTWDQEPQGGVGVYHGSVALPPFSTGSVTVTVKRGSTTIATILGKSYNSVPCPPNFINNYNAWVGYARGPSVSAKTYGDVSQLSCVKGFGVYDFMGMCDFACANGYCPSAACTCLKKGIATPPKELGKPGYPLSTKSGSFIGLCSFNCNHGYCPSTICSATPSTGVILNYSPFLPPTCTGGKAKDGAFAGLCSYACNFGFCPMAMCECVSTGLLNMPPAKTGDTNMKWLSGDDHGLCKFACDRGYCPSPCAKPPVPIVNLCDAADNTYSKDIIPKASIETWQVDGTTTDYLTGSPNQYVTIVNLTPYPMVFTGGPTPYQLPTFDFGNVPPGKARKNSITYDLYHDSTTTNGYANYKLEGTGKTFSVHITTHIPDKYPRRVVFDLGGMGLGWRELGFPGNNANVALVITGSDEYGYLSSLQLNNANWMRSMYSVIKDRQLRHVVVPGAHDAGMSKISSAGWFSGGIAANTETQSLDHYNQLRVGVRYFDMRIASINGGDFWTAHVSGWEDKLQPLGATGESLDDLILATNRFYTDYPGEVVVWSIKYMGDLDNGMTSVQDRWWTDDTRNRFYQQLQRINNRCPPNLGTEVTLEKRPMSLFMDANNGRGCVLLIVNGTRIPELVIDSPKDGIYANRYLPRIDFWPNVPTTKENADKQLTAMRDHKHDNGTSDAYFIMQWQPSPGALVTTGAPLTIQLLATQESNPALYHYAVNDFTPDFFPTVILHDAVGLFHVSDLDPANYDPAMQTLVIGLNLYTISQNCIVSNVKHPFKAPKAMAKTLGGSSGGFRPFRGVIFANGTVLDEAPPGFCRTCTYNDTMAIQHPVNGTRAVNGTAVAGGRRWTRARGLQ